MKIISKILILLFCGFSFIGFSQDLHFSQFYTNPLFFNPAETGNFDKDYRASLHQRTQWKSVSTPYKTVALNLDAANVLEHENINLGLSVFNDVAGDAAFKTFSTNLHFAYNHQLSDKNQIISLGSTFGFSQQNIDYSQLQFDEQYNGIFYDGNLVTGENFGSNQNAFLNLSIGLHYIKKKTENNYWEAGLALHNLLKPNQSLLGNDDIYRYVKTNIYTNIHLLIQPDFILIPRAYLAVQGGFSEFIIGSSAKFITENTPLVKRAIYAGLFFRAKDAGYVVVGLEYDSWTARASYDINFSELTPASRKKGGLEFSFIYELGTTKIFKSDKKICPDFL